MSAATDVGRAPGMPAPRTGAPRRPAREPSPGRRRPATQRRSRTGEAAQVVLCVAAVAGYFAVRSLTEGRTDAAYRNAERVLHLERAIGLPQEAVLQQAVVQFRTVTRLLDHFYVFGHWPVIVVVLSWLLVRHRGVFRRVRNTMFVSGLAGVVVFATFPVAPPRLLPTGFVDTIAGGSPAYRVLQPAAFTNQFAAMPSLHVGWNLVVGLALWAAGRALWQRLLAVAMPVLMAVAVVLTANHYLLDVVVGVVLAGGSWLLVGRARSQRLHAVVTRIAGRSPSSVSDSTPAWSSISTAQTAVIASMKTASTTGPAAVSPASTAAAPTASAAAPRRTSTVLRGSAGGRRRALRKASVPSSSPTPAMPRASRTSGTLPSSRKPA
jgi:membrane-associated phospholipid phosphatase